MNINKATICGRVTKDIELRSLPSGSQVATFSLATNHSYKTQSGEKKETTTFHNIVAFGRQAEVIAQYVVKGQELYIEGRIDNQSYDKKDGTKGYKSQIILETFQFGQKPKGAETGHTSESYQRKVENNQAAVPRERDEEDEINPDDIPF